jgi:16S rRNA (cytosine967-C5)-methyltransferase
LTHSRTLDEAMETAFADPPLEPRDRAFARAIASTVLRRLGELEAVLGSFVDKPPRTQGQAWPILLSGAAQLLFLETPPHAAISLAVDQVRADRRTPHLAGLVNAVLRKVATEGAARLAALDGPAVNVPGWLRERWSAAYGADAARAIAVASLREAALDLSVKGDAAQWAELLGGIVVPTGSVRVAARGPVEDLAGYGEGAWWVQDAAAALPARLLGPVGGLSVADLCAAPGGKTAELAASGARVTAVEASSARIGRLSANLSRLRLEADVVLADAAAYNPGRTFDAVLLDAPCTATGTIRRHPDILRLKRPDDAARLAVDQARLLDAAARLVRPGGQLIYCTCSLEREEGPDQIARFLAVAHGFRRRPLESRDVGGCAEFISPDGDLRTLPSHWPHETPSMAGLDGFFAARLERVT